MPGEDARAGFARDCKDRFNVLWASLSGLRTKLQRFERYMDDDFSWRASVENKNVENREIFQLRNDSLNIVGGFADFLIAQAKEDIRSTTPWFMAAPVGVADIQIADDITRHANWKFDLCGLNRTYDEAFSLAAGLGTAFVKLSYRREIDRYRTTAHLLTDLDTDEPVMDESGGYLEDEDKARAWAAGNPGRNVGWKPRSIVKEEIRFHGIDSRNLYYKDVAFDGTAPELDLLHTDFFHQFTMRLADVRDTYGLSEDEFQRIRTRVSDMTKAEADKPLDHRQEAAAYLPRASATVSGENDDTAMRIRLIEGYRSCDPLGDGTLCRVYVVFSPDDDMILKADYLANVTPNAEIPVHPVTIYRVPGRIVGRGMFERFEQVQDYIDIHWNGITHRAAMNANPIAGVHTENVTDDVENAQLDDRLKEGEEPKPFRVRMRIKPGTVFRLASGKRLADFIEFAEIPNLDAATKDLIDMMIQVAQMRTGITSASQGEIQGLPSTTTATGVRQLMSRASTLLKWPINEMRDSIRRSLRYAVKLLYANQNVAETFAYGEGQNRRLVTITPDAVADLDLDITLQVTQSASAERFDNATKALQAITTYLTLPESEKGPVRSLVVQQIRSLGFNDADQIVRPAIQLALPAPGAPGPGSAESQQPPSEPADAPAPAPPA